MAMCHLSQGMGASECTKIAQTSAVYRCEFGRSLTNRDEAPRCAMSLQESIASQQERERLASECQEGKKQPKAKVSGKDIPGTSGTQTSGYPRQKLYADGLFLLF